MRHKDDEEFAQLLNRLREGSHSEDDIHTVAILKQGFLNDENETFIYHKYTVDAHNNVLYMQMNIGKIIYLNCGEGYEFTQIKQF